MKDKVNSMLRIQGAIAVFFLACWIVNLVKLLSCDFDSPWKDEIVHAIGLIPPCSLVTAWL